MQNKNFGRLIKIAVSTIAINEGKPAVEIEEELGKITNVTGASIQRYKNGFIPPNPDTLKTIVSAGVKRAYLSRTWAESFLREGNYPKPMELLDELFPEKDDFSKPKRTFSNLPSPVYSQFIDRPEPYKEIITGLQRRSAVVLIISMGGFGKSSLALEIAGKTLVPESGLPHFDAAVWITDKSREGTTTQNVVLDEIAQTLEHSGLSGLPFKDKIKEVEKLLRYYRTLIIIDNAETITDANLLNWLIDIPEPSKVLLTTRIRSEIFFNNTTWVKLGGMSHDEAVTFIKHHVELLGISNLTGSANNLTKLIEATGGNPKAIRMALGYIKYKHQPLNSIIDKLYSANHSELFDDLFKKCWELLSGDAHRIIFTMHLYPCGATRDALSSICGFDNSTLQQHIERLSDFSLIDSSRFDINEEPLFTIHPLVRAFAKSVLKQDAKIETELREKWIFRYKTIASGIGFAWKQMDRLSLLDIQGESEAMISVIEWCHENGRHSDVIEISKNVRYYYYVRGFWSNERSINLLRASSAHQISQHTEEFEALVYHINIASKQGNMAEVEKHLPRLEELSTRDISISNTAAYRHAKALYYLEKGEPETSLALWKENISISEDLTEYEVNVHRRWYAQCLCKLGKDREAFDLFTDMEKESEKANFKRGVLSSRIGIAYTSLALGNTDTLDAYLDDLLAESISIKDQMFIGQIYFLFGKLYTAKKEPLTAKEYLVKAAEKFRSLGHKSMLQEAEKMLQEH